MDKIVVMIADKQALFRVGVCNALSKQPEFEVLNAAPDDKLMRLIEANSPNVLLLDIDYPSLSGLDLARKIALHCPTTRIIMLTLYLDDQQLFEIIKAGAVGFLHKSVTAEELNDTVMRVSHGEYPINDSVLARPRVAKHVLRQFQSMQGNNGRQRECGCSSYRQRDTDSELHCRW